MESIENIGILWKQKHTKAHEKGEWIALRSMARASADIEKYNNGIHGSYMDERIKSNTYEAGYLAFVISFPLTVLSVILRGSENIILQTYAPLELLVSLACGVGVFIARMLDVKIITNLAKRLLGMVAVNPRQRFIRGILLDILSLPPVAIYIDYLLTTFIEGSAWTVTQHPWRSGAIFILLWAVSSVISGYIIAQERERIIVFRPDELLVQNYAKAGYAAWVLLSVASIGAYFSMMFGGETGNAVAIVLLGVAFFGGLITFIVSLRRSKSHEMEIESVARNIVQYKFNRWMIVYGAIMAFVLMMGMTFFLQSVVMGTELDFVKELRIGVSTVVLTGGVMYVFYIRKMRKKMREEREQM